MIRINFKHAKGQFLFAIVLIPILKSSKIAPGSIWYEQNFILDKLCFAQIIPSKLLGSNLCVCRLNYSIVIWTYTCVYEWVTECLGSFGHYLSMCSILESHSVVILSLVRPLWPHSPLWFKIWCELLWLNSCIFKASRINLSTFYGMPTWIGSAGIRVTLDIFSFD